MIYVKYFNLTTKFDNLYHFLSSSISIEIGLLYIFCDYASALVRSMYQNNIKKTSKPKPRK